ncbi:unnamed protein product [Closterium sp. NIES-54]
MIHAAAPHFLWPFAVQYAAHQLNLQPRVSLPETSPTLRWTGKVGDASAFRVWGSRAFVRDLSADKLSPRAVPCVFLGFPPDAPGWQSYHPTSRRVLSSHDVTFDESVPYYHLFPYRTAPLPPPPLFLAPGPPPVDPLPPQGPAPSGVSQVDAVGPVEVAVDSSAARGTEPVGAESGGAEPGDAEPEGAEPRSAEAGGAEPGGAEAEGAESARMASRTVLLELEVLLLLLVHEVLVLAVLELLGVLALELVLLEVLDLLVLELIAPEGDPDAPDIPTPRSYAEAIEGPYSSQWQSAMDAEMASWNRGRLVLYVDNKAMLALCREHRLEHRTKHIALRYFLARELQQRGQLRLAYVASEANTADIFTKALPPGDHQRFCTMLGLVPTWPHLLTS